MRYALEIHLIEVDDAGTPVKTLDVASVQHVSDSLGSMCASLDWLGECLGNAIYDHHDENETLTDRYTSESYEDDSTYEPKDAI